MEIQNPFMHYPRYSVRICKKNGEEFFKRGTSQKILNLPVEEEDVLVLVIEALDSGRRVCNSRMWVDGIYAKYSEAELERLLNPPVPEPEPAEIEEEVNEEVSFESEAAYEVIRQEENDADAADSRYGQGCE